VYTTKLSNFDAVEKFNFEGLKVDRERLQVELEECRLLKSPEEISLMRHVNAVSSWAHTQIMRLCRPGMGEHELEAAFQYLTYKNGRCRHQAYICICASGASGATLHYPNNDKQVRDGQMLLLDMGGEYHCYCSDITCSFPANGHFTPDQRAIYNIVLRANQAVMRAMRPGVDWTDMHRLAERVICQGLLEMGLLRGEEKALLAAHIPALFFPHGLGHLLGLDTHDPGGYPAGLEHIQEPGIRYLRTRRVLQAGMVVTVEPGLYFNKASLLPALESPDTAHFFDVERVKGMMDFGGVRIEDDVLVTADGCENLTKVPRTVEEIEAVMAEGRATLGVRSKSSHQDGCCKH
jgi:Xaa-Pro dipeptidase